MEVLCSLKIFSLEIFFHSCVCACVILHVIFLSLWNFLSCLCCEEMFIILQGPVPVLPGLWISSCSPFPVELTAQTFLLPSSSLLFYHSTDTVFLLDSVSFFLPCPTVTSLGGEFVPDSLQVFLSQYCEFSKLFLELGWMVYFLISLSPFALWEGPSCDVSTKEL